jgi:hypothetical protein
VFTRPNAVPGRIAQALNDKRYNLFKGVLGAGFRGIMPQQAAEKVAVRSGRHPSAAKAGFIAWHLTYGLKAVPFGKIVFPQPVKSCPDTGQSFSAACQTTSAPGVDFVVRTLRLASA